ncbi:Hsp70 family protein [Winogradskyella sp.]|nr:Hsp70 family protein [Winogradskyella sp.]
MSRIKYGIDLGTTNSAIAVIEKGESLIIKSEVQKDTIPSCVGFNKKKSLSVGDRAFNQLGIDKLRVLNTGEKMNSNTYIEFKRTMGSDKKYHSSFMESDFSSEELSAEVLKKLKSFVQNENFKSIVITIPAMFNDNQKSATQKAAELAGFTQVELLQEPIAAAMAYGLDDKVKDGQILIFDFGGGTFDVCLVNVEDGIMQVKDTEGDNWLGGKNLDNAIVDEILFPYLKENFSIQSFIDDENKNSLLKDALKVKAEEIKVNLSFSKSFDVISNLGEYPEDDDGEEIELDFVVTHDQMITVLGPVFQKAVDIAKDVLTRNLLKGDDLNSLILVGGPTFSPVLRELLATQICSPHTSVDPMTVVARGAALYASQFDIYEVIVDEVRDDTKIQLEIFYESQTVEAEEMVVVKLNKSKIKGETPSKLFVSVKRSDGGWGSNKVELDEAGDIIDLVLREGKPNNFELLLTNETGDNLPCEPNEFTIIHGVKTGNATLAYNYGVELLGDNGKANFYTIPGLEKGQTMPANGEKAGLKTLKDIRPGSSDEINISIYQGNIDAEGTRASNQTWVSTVCLNGNDIPRLLPKGSEVNLFLEVVKDGVYNLSIDIPFLNDTIEKIFEKHEQQAEDDSWFMGQFKNIEVEIAAFEKQNDSFDKDRLEQIKTNVKASKAEFESRKSDYDTRMKVRDDLRKQYTALDNLTNISAWPISEQELKSTFYELETKAASSDDSSIRSAFDTLKIRMDRVLSSKDVQEAKELKSDMGTLYVQILDNEHGVELFISILMNMNDDFDSQPWTDRSRARNVLNTAMKEVMANPSRARALSYCQQLWGLLPNPKEADFRDDILG